MGKRVELADNEWNQVVNILAEKPFREVGVVISKMMQQLQAPQLPANGEATFRHATIPPTDEKGPAPNG